MKKLLAILMCLLIAVSMAFVMTGCGEEEKKADVKTSTVSKDKDKDKEDKDNEDEDEEDNKTASSKNSIVGSWALKCDYTTYTELITMGLDEDEIEEMGLNDLTYDCIYEFSKNGELLVYIDEDSANDWADNVKKCYIDFYSDFWEDEEAGNDSYTQLAERYIESLLDSAGEEKGYEYEYKTKGNTLTLLAEDEEIECEFKVKNDTLTIEMPNETLTLKRK